MFGTQDKLQVRWNLELIGYDRGKRKVLHERTHNIVVNNGRQFLLENLTASAFSGGGFTRVQNTVVQYIGLGLGGTRQNAPDAASGVLAELYPAGYGGTNVQTDDDLTVGRLERPVKATQQYWLRQVGAPAEFPTSTSVRWSALFDVPDVNIDPFHSVPVSEIGLYSSAADPTKPNGGGTYPGTAGFLLAYDTFIPLHKTGYWSLLARWTWKI